MILPPPGSDPRIIADFVDRVVRESEQDDRRVCWAPEAERALNLYIGNHYDTPAPADQIRLILNRIQNCIISLVAIQAGDEPKITFTPRETGDPPLVYLNTKLPEVQQLIQELIGSGAVFDPMQPLPQQLAQVVEQRVEAGEVIKAQAAAMGQPAPPGLLPKEAIVEVTDQTASQALQTVFDGMWEECDAHMVFAENIMNKNIVGWQPTLFEFNDDEKRHVLTNVHPKQVFVDPLYSDSSRWQYAIYDQLVSIDEAKAKWPRLSKQLDLVAKEGTPQPVGHRTYDSAAQYQKNYQRHMVIVRTAWFRFQPYPMDPEHALDSGKLAELQTGYEQPPLDAASADPMNPAPAEPKPTTGYFAPGTPTDETGMVAPGAEQVTPDHPSWPMRQGIREIIIVANEMARDQECEHADIPLPTNRNIPIPFSPYGQGEPKRLEGVQMAINRLLSSVVTHQAYNAYPPELIPQAVLDRLDKSLQKARSKPGQRFAIPADLVTLVQGDLKKLLQTVDIPQLPTDFWKLLDLLLSLIDKEGNQADVTQGNASATWSGKTVENLQNAASQVIRGKSMFTEFYLKRLAKLMVHAIITRLDVDDWQRYVSRYPVQALQAIHDRAKSLYVDIAVEITSGSGAAKQAQTQNIVAARQMGVPISDPTLMEQLNLDPETELQKTLEWQRKLQVNAPAAANNPPAAAGPPKDTTSGGGAQGQTAAQPAA
jgi:hypothetical protein